MVVMIRNIDMKNWKITRVPLRKKVSGPFNNFPFNTVTVLNPERTMAGYRPANTPTTTAASITDK